MPKIELGSALQAKTGEPLVIVCIGEERAYMTADQAVTFSIELGHEIRRALAMAWKERDRRRTAHVYKHGGGK
jgi:hypothetical protein